MVFRQRFVVLGIVLSVSTLTVGGPAASRTQPGVDGWQGQRDRALARVAAADEALRRPGLGSALAAAAGLAAEDIAARTAAGSTADQGIAALIRSIARAERIVGADASRLYEAAVLVATAIDTARPALATDISARTPGGGTGCDVVDQPPGLCIGGSGPNTYTADYALLVDMGGQDRYENSAGGADPVYNGLAVSVLIDLGGDDIYDSPHPARSGAMAVQGAGGIGGIGILVDAAGDDSYRVSSTHVSVSAYGQGSGVAGVGVLLDEAGNDVYLLEHRAPAAGGFSYRSAQGMGSGGLGGAGLLLDRGGDDRYSLRATPVPTEDADKTLRLNDARAQGFGNGAAGVGIFQDSGGNDVAELIASAGPVPSDRLGPVAGGAATLWGIGYGAAGGAGLAVTGAGSMTWRARATVEAPHTASGPMSETASTGAMVMGMGQLGGLGALQDHGGDDTYDLQTRTEAVSSQVVGAGCGCAGVNREAKARGSIAHAMGFGGPGGAGILVDSDGNDTYRASAVSAARAQVSDERNAPGPEDAGATATATSGNALTRVAGVGFGGVGVLHDLDGNDVYVSDSSSTASAEAGAASPQVQTNGLASSARSMSLSQGAADVGYAELIDRGGADDYASTNASTATATPATSVVRGEPISSVQASVDNGGVVLFMNVEVGVPDGFSATPEDPACVGVRGQATWVDCGTGVATGTVV